MGSSEILSNPYNSVVPFLGQCSCVSRHRACGGCIWVRSLYGCYQYKVIRFNDKVLKDNLQRKKKK